jgi:hypothetical protein
VVLIDGAKITVNKGLPSDQNGDQSSDSKPPWASVIDGTKSNSGLIGIPVCCAGITINPMFNLTAKL